MHPPFAPLQPAFQQQIATGQAPAGWFRQGLHPGDVTIHSLTFQPIPDSTHRFAIPPPYEFRSRFRAHRQKPVPQGVQGQTGGHGTRRLRDPPQLGIRPDQELRRGDPRLVIDFKGKKAPRDGPGLLRRHDGGPAAPSTCSCARRPSPRRSPELIAEDPAQLVVEALEAYPNKATTAIDLEITLSQVVGEEKFKKWWSAAKKAVAKDPRIAVPEKKTECYVLRESPSRPRTRSSSSSTAPAPPAAASRSPRISSPPPAKKEVQGRPRTRPQGRGRRGQGQQPARCRRAPLRRRRPRRPGEGRRRRCRRASSPSQAALVRERPRPARDRREDPRAVPGRFLDLVKETHPIECRDIVFTLLKVSPGQVHDRVHQFPRRERLFRGPGRHAQALADRAEPARPRPAVDRQEPPFQEVRQAAQRPHHPAPPERHLLRHRLRGPPGRRARAASRWRKS